MSLRYDGPMEAVLGIFDLMIEYGQPMATPAGDRRRCWSGGDPGRRDVGMGRAALEVTAGPRVFLYGTLCHPPLLATVLQRAVELHPGNACADHAIFRRVWR